MKIKNKKTGEIVDAFSLGAEKSVWGKQGKHFKLSTDDWCKNYNSLAELNEEWEDYEEPKEHFVITCDGKIITTAEEFTTIDECDEIGNYFETREEAEKAVEKLKAWKRLRDKGFRFTGLAGISNSISFTANKEYESSHINYDPYIEHGYDINKYVEDLDLLFGGDDVLC